jgi:hypothetical protein
MWSAVRFPISPFQVAENLLRQRHGGKADRDRTRSEAGLRPHALAGGERRVEQPVQQRAGGMDFSRSGVRVLHLPENLRLADDEGVEAGGNAEEVARRVEVQALVEVRLHDRPIDGVKLGDEVQ